MMLTHKQERFCIEYMQGGNASQAYRRVYNADNMSKATVNREASELLHNPKIATRIQRLRAEAAENAVGKEVDIIRQAANIAFSDVAQMLYADGRLRDIHEMPPEARAAIASFSVLELFEGKGNKRKHVGRIKRVRLWDKNAALAMLMKRLGMFEPREKQPTSIFADVSRDTLKELERLLAKQVSAGRG